MINRKALIREIKAFILSRLLLFSGGVKAVDRHLQDGVEGEVEKKEVLWHSWKDKSDGKKNGQKEGAARE